jgi:biotin transport system substrate-specific component
MFLAFSGSVLLALCAHVSVPLVFTPVPLTLQTFAVLLTGLVLGPSLGFSSMVLYLAEGAGGLPVFSPAGPGGLAQLFGPTGGYLVAYPFAAALAGFIVRAFGIRRSPFGAALVAGSAAMVVTLLIGGLWITSFTHATWRTTTAIGVAPFVPGEVIKIIAAAGLFASFRRYVRH